jgi:hypothetical protein
MRVLIFIVVSNYQQPLPQPGLPVGPALMRVLIFIVVSNYQQPPPPQPPVPVGPALMRVLIFIVVSLPAARAAAAAASRSGLDARLDLHRRLPTSSRRSRRRFRYLVRP